MKPNRFSPVHLEVIDERLHGKLHLNGDSLSASLES
jgi:hypothetical protein